MGERYTMQYVDKDPWFMSWLNTGLQKSMRLAKRSNTEAGYYYALAYYTLGFHNGHIKVGIGKLPYQYAGLLFKYQNGKYLVKYCAPKYHKLPPINAELLSCDNLPV